MFSLLILINHTPQYYATITTLLIEGEIFWGAIGPTSEVART